MLPKISSVINPLIISPGYLLAATSVCENKNVDSRSWSVVKYVINNIMITALTGRRKTAT